MSENKYGNLLDKYMKKESNNSNKILNDFTRSKKEEGKGKYGTLLNNVDKFPTIYDKILDVENATRKMNQEEAEKQAKARAEAARAEAEAEAALLAEEEAAAKAKGKAAKAAKKAARAQNAGDAE